jgi:hypothetical protein
MRREPQRLDELPETGRVTIGHPLRAASVVEIARENLTDYVLLSIHPPASVTVVNVDQLSAAPVVGAAA